MDHYKNVSNAVVNISSLDGWIRINPGETAEIDLKRLEKDGDKKSPKTDLQKYLALKWVEKVKAPENHPPEDMAPVDQPDGSSPEDGEGEG